MTTMNDSLEVVLKTDARGRLAEDFADSPSLFRLPALALHNPVLKVPGYRS